MILNNYITTYLVCSLLSIFVGLIAGLNGFYIWKNWDINNPAEKQYALEKNVYLILHSQVILYAQVKEPQMPEKDSPVFG